MGFNVLIMKAQLTTASYTVVSATAGTECSEQLYLATSLVYIQTNSPHYHPITK